jgi:hypothetical protein
MRARAFDDAGFTGRDRQGAGSEKKAGYARATPKSPIRLLFNFGIQVQLKPEQDEANDTKIRI